MCSILYFIWHIVLYESKWYRRIKTKRRSLEEWCFLTARDSTPQLIITKDDPKLMKLMRLFQHKDIVYIYNDFGANVKMDIVEFNRYLKILDCKLLKLVED